MLAFFGNDVRGQASESVDTGQLLQKWKLQADSIITAAVDLELRNHPINSDDISPEQLEQLLQDLDPQDASSVNTVLQVLWASIESGIDADELNKIELPDGFELVPREPIDADSDLPMTSKMKFIFRGYDYRVDVEDMTMPITYVREADIKAAVSHQDGDATAYIYSVDSQDQAISSIEELYYVPAPPEHSRFTIEPGASENEISVREDVRPDVSAVYDVRVRDGFVTKKVTTYRNDDSEVYRKYIFQKPKDDWGSGTFPSIRVDATYLNNRLVSCNYVGILNVELNTGIDDEVFYIECEKGTVVIDYRESAESPSTFILDSRCNDIVEFVRQQLEPFQPQLEPVQPQLEPVQPDVKSSRPVWLMCSLFILVVGTVALLKVRSR